MLHDLQVVEFAGVLAGPSAGMFLAELGASVVKIEPPGGDVTRSWKLGSEDPAADRPAYFCSVNWGKRSLALDLRQPEAQQIALQLCRQADIVLSSFIPGAAARLGLDADTLLRLNPRLICAEINGYGPDVPRAAYDAIIQAEAGFTYLNGLPGQIFKMPVALMDVLAAHQLKEAILLALLRRIRTGRGGRVSVSLLQAGVSALVNQAGNWLTARHLPQPIGSEHPNIVPYGTLFMTAGGQPVVLAVGTDAQFAALCGVLGLPQRPEFSSNVQRVQRRREVGEWLQQAMARQERDALLAALLDRQVPAGAVHSMAEVFALPQAQALVLESDGLAGVRNAAAEGLELVPADELLPPPALGAHTREILAGLGIDPEPLLASGAARG
ncbi:MAG: CoA transferase [Bacteroidia bacterium]|nr:CoA transferase [Bacteroidia bacterium]